MSSDIIDEEGRVFGTNALAEETSAEEEPITEQQTVIVQTTVPPYVADAIEDGSPIAEDVTAVSDVRVVEKTVVNDTDAGTATRYRVRFTATLVTQSDENGLPTFRDERLYVGQQVRLDLGTTIIDGVVVEMRDR